MDMTGKVLRDRYEIEELIGSGGMARVYKARCRQLNRYVAIKVLREELKDDKEFVEKFKTEALAAASLTHPNIVSVFDSGEEDGIYYFVMEYVDGYTLKQYIARKGALDWKEACNITLGIYSAIEHAHKNNIVHRDIKPHNIMLNSDGVVKVTDFGIARAVSSSTIVRGGNIIGSVHYFSPEQARGAASTFKSDIYSIGIVFYEMLTGRVPFDANDPFNVAKMQVEQTPIEPKRLNESIPKSINAVVMRALAKKPEERYNNVTEMINAIKNAIDVANTYGDDTFAAAVHDDFDETTEVPVVISNENKNSGKKEKKEKKSEPKDKSSMILGVVIGIVIVVGAIMGITLSNGFTGEKKHVISFVGQNFEDVEEEYKDSKIYNIVLDEEEFSDEYDEGVIMDQTPEAGSRYTENELPLTIRVVVSSGTGIKMKDYIGEDGLETEYKLSRDGYDVEIKERSSDKYDEGLIIRTIPQAGNALRQGDRIILYVSTGPEEDNSTDEPKPDDTQQKPEDESEKPGNGNESTTNPQPSGNDEGSENNTGTGNQPPSNVPDHGTSTTKPSDNPYEGL